MKFELVREDEARIEAASPGTGTQSGGPMEEHPPGLPDPQTSTRAPMQAMSSINAAISEMRSSLAQLDARVVRYQAEMAETGREDPAPPPADFHAHRFGPVRPKQDEDDATPDAEAAR